MSAEGKNFESIARARDEHNSNCPAPAHTVLMHPIDIERMDWEEGDVIAGLQLKAEPTIGTGTFHLLCDRGKDRPEGEAVEAVSERELVEA